MLLVEDELSLRVVARRLAANVMAVRLAMDVIINVAAVKAAHAAALTNLTWLSSPERALAAKSSECQRAAHQRLRRGK